MRHQVPHRHVALPAAASTWEIDPNHTESSFVVKHLMVSNVRGQFGKTTGTIVQDDKDLTKSKAEITIDERVSAEAAVARVPSSWLRTRVMRSRRATTRANVSRSTATSPSPCARRSSAAATTNKGSRRWS